MSKFEFKGRPGLSRRSFGKLFGAAAIGAPFAALTTRSSALAQGFPSGPITIVVGYPPGGTADTVARIVAERLHAELGSVIVENRPGASASIAAQHVASSEPDGHTLLFGNTTEIVINKHVLGQTNFDPDADLVPVAFNYVSTHALVVSPDSPYHTLEDYIADARNRPGQVQFASAGIGTPQHFAGTLLGNLTGTELVHVPYQGGSQAMTDVLGGHVNMYFAVLPGAMGYLESGALRALAVSAPTRAQRLPDIPTVAEVLGLDSFDFPIWGGLFAPAGTDPAIVTSINAATRKVFSDPETAQRIQSLGFEIEFFDQQQFAQFVAAESEKYTALVADIQL